MPGLPERVLGCYWTYWNGPALASLPPAYNTVYLFSALPAGGAPGTTGGVTWSQDREPAARFRASLAGLRAAGRCVILSAGGAHAYLRLDTTGRADAFIASITAIHRELGGFDGVDLDIEGGPVWPGQLGYVARSLKAAFGAGFAITIPPGPWDAAAQRACRALCTAGLVDFVAPQYYDMTGPGSEAARISYLTTASEEWLGVVNGRASKLGLGYGMPPAAVQTMSLASFAAAWTRLRRAHPALRGVFCWEAAADASQGYPFAATMAPLVTP